MKCSLLFRFLLLGINEAKRKAESAQKLRMISSQLQGIPAKKKFDLLQPHRRFLFEGVLKIKEDGRIKDGKYRLEKILFYNN